ncbi:S-layer homology domain-containing protein [Cohnella sp. WQ 127256]|uniref:S-layer homology domain-containing protein n=1 Tax=Cohnella sp. WQ 127256 TaxID=2938790 RepID=UPI002119804C|nr:S-layer homology domain-containing protein [Cohnella sp. WQ 127256]
MDLYLKSKKLGILTLILCLIGSIFTNTAEASGTRTGYSQPPWKEVTPSPSPGPSARFASAMAYDEETGNTVLFGGADFNYDVLNDTWVWDGDKWTDVTPADPNDSPEPNEYGEMAYGGPENGMLFFGGENVNYYNKTWLWDGAKWNDVTPADTSVNYPPARQQFSMVYIGDGEVLLYGGFGEYGYLYDTWIWNKMGWREVTPVDPNDSPTYIHRTSIAYDKKNDEVVLFGGYTSNTPPLSNKTWIWDGHVWNLRTPATSPPPRVFASMVYDSSIEKVILVGGEATYVPKDDVWFWDGDTWTEQVEANLPTLSLSNMVFDSRKGQTVLFSGYNDDYLFETTWTHRISEVSEVKMTPSSNVENTVTDWSVEFTTGHYGSLIGGTDTLTVQAPVGTTLPSSNLNYTIEGVPALSVTQTASNEATLTLSQNIAANTSVSILISSVTNPSSGSYTSTDFVLATSQDIVWTTASEGMVFIVPDHIELIATPSMVTVGGSISVAGIVYDSNEIPATGVVVSLTVTSGSLGSSKVTTDAKGQFSTIFTASSVPETVTITAVDIANQSVQGTASVQVNRAVPVPDHIQLVVTPSTITIGGNVSITGVVNDSQAMPISGAIVVLTATSGRLGSSRMTTDVSGQFSTTFTAPSVPGTVTITAVDNTNPSVTGNATVQVNNRSNGGNTGGSVGGGQPSSPLSSTNGKLTVPPGKQGTVSLGDEVTVSIPANSTPKELQITIEKVLNPKDIPVNANNQITSIYAISKNIPDDFTKPATLTISFDPTKLNSDEYPVVFYFDEMKKNWVQVSGSQVTGKQISVDITHLGTFAVFGVPNKGNSPTPEMTFSDIAGHWAEASIKQAVRSGIVKGYPDGSFKPNRTVTRAEFAVMLMNALQSQDEGAALSFMDSSKIGQWARIAVAQAVQAGLIKGFEDGSFRPDVDITRSEMAVMIARALRLASEEKLTSFTDDSHIPAWAKSAVDLISNRGIMQGKGSNTFFPNDKTTRAEAVTVLINLLAHIPPRG